MLLQDAVRAVLHDTTLSHATILWQAYDILVVSCKSNLQLAYDCRVRQKIVVGV